MQNQKSQYGFFNHFVISAEQKETANRYGLVIDNKGDGQFEVTSRHGTAALQEIVSPYATVSESGSAHLHRHDLKLFLNFLRQPIAGSLDKNDRMTGHAVTRFMTTGHVEISPFLDEGLASAASLECHEKGERKMKENDIWNNEPEFWNPEMNSEKVSSIPGTSYDPQKGFVFTLDQDFVKGAWLQKPNRRKLSGIIAETLRDVMGEQVDLSGEVLHLNAKEIKEFYSKIKQVPEIDLVITGARIEEKAEAKLKIIRDNAQELKTDARFQIATHARDPRVSDAMKFDNLIAASSYLMPIVSSQDMFNTWRNSHRTEYWMKLSDPVKEVSEEMRVFMMVLDDIRNSQDVDAEHLQAIIHDFRPLVAFASDLIQSMKEGADHKKIAKALPEEKRVQFKQELSTLGEAFTQASVNGVEAGDLDGDYDELLTGVGNVLGQNGNMAVQQLDGYKDMMVGFWKGVGESAFDSPVVAGLLVGFVGYAWYTKYGVDTSMAQQTVETVFGGFDGGSFTLDGGGVDFGGDGFTVPQDVLDSFEKTGNEVIEEAKESGEIDTCLISTNCHYNYLVPQFLTDIVDDSVGQYLKFRHYVGSDIIANNANTVVSLLPSAVESAYESIDITVNHNTVFRDVAAATTEQSGLFVIDANMFQDGSHASMLAYGVSRAGKNGVGAFKGMGGLAAEFFNPAYRIGETILVNPVKRVGAASANLAATTAGFTGIVSPDLAGQAMGWARDVKASARPAYETKLIETSMTKVSGAAGKIKLTDAAEAADVKNKNAPTKNISINLGWYGLKRESISISDDILEELEDKLNKFALVLKYSAEDIGIESESYTDFALKKLENVENALKAYKASNAEDRLKTLRNDLNGDLQHVIGAELKFNGRDELYRTFFKEPESQKRGFLSRLFTERAEVKDDRRLHVLARHASKKEGRLLRKEYNQDMADRRSETENRFQKPEKLLSVQSLKYTWGEVEKYAAKAKYTGAQAFNHAWGGIVFGAREGIQEPFNQIPSKGKLALAFGAACMGGLMADVAGVESALTNTFSAAGAAISGVTATGVIAGLMNIPQDLALHTLAIGVSAGVVGVPWYYAVKKGIKPAAQGVSEKLSPSMG